MNTMVIPERGEKRWKQVKDSMWIGVVLGSIQLLDGTWAVLVQGDKLFLSDPSSLHKMEEREKFVRY